MQAEQPEDQPAERALHDRDQDRALDHGAHDDGEFLEQRALLLGPERERILDALRDLGAVAKEEEQEIEHDEQADDEVRRALADEDGLRGEELAALFEERDQPALDVADIGHAEPVEQVAREAR